MQLLQQNVNGCSTKSFPVQCRTTAWPAECAALHHLRRTRDPRFSRVQLSADVYITSRTARCLFFYVLPFHSAGTPVIHSSSTGPPHIRLRTAQAKYRSPDKRRSQNLPQSSTHVHAAITLPECCASRSGAGTHVLVFLDDNGVQASVCKFQKDGLSHQRVQHACGVPAPVQIAQQHPQVSVAQSFENGLRIAQAAQPLRWYRVRRRVAVRGLFAGLRRCRRVRFPATALLLLVVPVAVARAVPRQAARTAVAGLAATAHTADQLFASHDRARLRPRLTL